MTASTVARTLCARCGLTMQAGTIKYGHLWCKDCRDVDPGIYRSHGYGRTASRKYLIEVEALWQLGYSFDDIVERTRAPKTAVRRELDRLTAHGQHPAATISQLEGRRNS